MSLIPVCTVMSTCLSKTLCKFEKILASLTFFITDYDGWSFLWIEPALQNTILQLQQKQSYINQRHADTVTSEIPKVMFVIIKLYQKRGFC